MRDVLRDRSGADDDIDGALRLTLEKADGESSRLASAESTFPQVGSRAGKRVVTERILPERLDAEESRTWYREK